MNPPQRSRAWFRAPQLTRTRIILALIIAIAADAAQFLLGIFGWAGIDEGIDLVVMVLATWLLGFHWLLLPTAVLEFLPVIDDLPTWTACVVAVIALRRRPQRQPSPAPPAVPPPGSGPVIDV